MPLDWMWGGGFQEQLFLELELSPEQIKERKREVGGSLPGKDLNTSLYIVSWIASTFSCP